MKTSLFTFNQPLNQSFYSHNSTSLASVTIQESLANAKVSARQQCVYMKARL